MTLSPAWVGFLEQEGFEAVHWASVGASTASDIEIMEWLGSATISCSRMTWTFSALLAVTGAAGPSVLQIRAQDVMLNIVGRDVVRVLNMRAEAFSAGARRARPCAGAAPRRGLPARAPRGRGEGDGA